MVMQPVDISHFSRISTYTQHAELLNKTEKPMECLFVQVSRTQCVGCVHMRAFVQNCAHLHLRIAVSSMFTTSDLGTLSMSLGK